MPLHSADGFPTNAESGGDNPHTPASEPARSQPPSPQKKRRKVSRSQSIPAQPTNPPGGFYPPPNVYAPPNDGGMVVHPSPYDDPMHGGPGMHMGPHMAAGPHPGHPMMHSGGPMPPHMQPHMQQHPGSPHPMSGGGHPMSHMSASRYMRQASVPMAPPHMSPHGGGGGGMPPGHMHPPQGMSAQMGGHMPPGGPVGPGAPPGMQQPYSPGLVSSMSNRIYPTDQPMIFNQSNPHAPPIYPCGICHKEINDSDQAMLCEVGCSFWFHRLCTGLTELAFQQLAKEPFAVWACDPCINKKSIPPIIIKS